MKNVKLCAGTALLLLCLALAGCPDANIGKTGNGAEKPVILTQPNGGDRVYRAGTSTGVTPLSVTVAEPKDGGELSYQWYRATSLRGEGAIIPGAKEKTYTPVIPQSSEIQYDNTKLYYYVIVTNTNTKASTVSERAVITITLSDTVPAQLSLTYAVNTAGSAFTGTNSSGETISATLESGASIVDAKKLNGQANGFKAVNTGSAGYIALGDEVGKILKTLDGWTLETYIFIPAGAVLSGSGNHIISFGNTDNYTSANQIGPTMWVRANDLGMEVHSAGWGGESGVTDQQSIDARGQWRHLVFTQDSDAPFGAYAINVYLDGERVGAGAVTEELKSTSLEVYNYGYLGRSIFHANGDSTLRNTQFLQFAVYTGAMTMEQIQALGAAEKLYQLNGIQFDFTLTDNKLVEGSEFVGPGAEIGTFASNGAPPLTYALVSGEGDTDNGLFTIDGDQLKVGAAALTRGTKSVRVGVTDDNGDTFENIYTIAIAEDLSGSPIKLWFTFDNQTGNTVKDKTYNHTGTLQDGATIKKYGSINLLSLASAGNWFDLGADAGSIITANNPRTFTISTYLYVGSGASLSGTGWQPWSFTASGAMPESTGGPAINYQIRTNEQEVDLATPNNTRQWVYSNSSGSGFPRNEWVHVVYVQSNNTTGTLYMNNNQIVQSTGLNTAAGLTDLVVNFLGRPSRGANFMVDTYYADFRMYNTVLDSSGRSNLRTELQDTYRSVELYMYKDSVESALLPALAGVTGNLTLPTGSGAVSVAWTSDNPSVISTAGVVNRPAAGQPAVDVTLTATYSASGVTSITATYTATVRPLMNPEDIKLFHMTVTGSTINSLAGKADAVGTMSFENGTNSGRAIVFDNTANRYINVTKMDDTPLLAGVEEITVSFWVRRGSATTSWWFFAARDTTQMNSPEYYLGAYTTARQVRSQRFFNGRNAPAAAVVETPANTLDNNTTTWYHVTVLHGRDFTELYLNGSRVGSRQNVNQPISAIVGPTPVLFIGRSTWQSGGEWATGAVQDYRIYGGILSPAQISAIYTAGAE